MRRIIGGNAVKGGAASTGQMGRSETELLDERFRGFLAASTGDDPAAFTPHGAPQGAVGPSPAASRLEVNGGKVSSSGMPGMSCTR